MSAREGFTVASSVLPGSSAEQVSRFYESINETEG